MSTVIFKSSCSINVKYFPFDEQQCDMIFASWTYDGFFLDINVNVGEGDTTNYIKNGEWHLVKILAVKHLKIYSCCEEPYPELQYKLIIRRRPLYYVFNMVFPCLLITMVAFLGFYLSPNSSEKVSIGITTLLSLTVYLMLVAESMPPTSEQLPLLGIYYAVTLSIVSFSTAMAVLTLNINNKGNKGRKVPRFIRIVFLKYLANLLGTELSAKKEKIIFETSKVHSTNIINDENILKVYYSPYEIKPENKNSFNITSEVSSNFNENKLEEEKFCLKKEIFEESEEEINLKSVAKNSNIFRKFLNISIDNLSKQYCSTKNTFYEKGNLQPSLMPKRPSSLFDYENISMSKFHSFSDTFIEKDTFNSFSVLCPQTPLSGAKLDCVCNCSSLDLNINENSSSNICNYQNNDNIETLSTNFNFKNTNKNRNFEIKNESFLYKKNSNEKDLNKKYACNQQNEKKKQNDTEFLKKLESILEKQFSPLVNILLITLEQNQNHKDQEEKLLKIQDEWSDVALVLDHVFCYFFPIITLLTCIIIFVNSPHVFSSW
jgi:hypothetical protein